MKLPLLVAAYRLHERGELDLDVEVPVHNEHRSAYDGTPFSLDQADDQDDETWARIGTTASLRDLARHATVKSGNLATDLLLEHVGSRRGRRRAAGRRLLPDTALPRGIADTAARRAGLDNLVTAADLARVLGAVAARWLATPRDLRGDRAGARRAGAPGTGAGGASDGHLRGPQDRLGRRGRPRRGPRAARAPPRRT